MLTLDTAASIMQLKELARCKRYLLFLNDRKRSDKSCQGFGTPGTKMLRQERKPFFKGLMDRIDGQ